MSNNNNNNNKFSDISPLKNEVRIRDILKKGLYMSDKEAFALADMLKEYTKMLYLGVKVNIACDDIETAIKQCTTAREIYATLKNTIFEIEKLSYTGSKQGFDRDVLADFQTECAKLRFCIFVVENEVDDAIDTQRLSKAFTYIKSNPLTKQVFDYLNGSHSFQTLPQIAEAVNASQLDTDDILTQLDKMKIIYYGPKVTLRREAKRFLDRFYKEDSNSHV